MTKYNVSPLVAREIEFSTGTIFGGSWCRYFISITLHQCYIEATWKTKNRQYVQGTRILKQEYFEERLYSFHSMREENRASYVLLKLEYPKMTLEEADTALQASVRENDVRGISEKGELFLILSQTDRSSLPIILARLENDGFVCHEINTVENANTGEKL